ncbi:MAG: hypothetical protein SFW67_24160 [Myxococcaceae bacterium]|nr:hypothetical protein [Myxococcaceae bacterium]
MSNVKVADFIRSSASYVRANVAQANKDGNSFLTKTEAKALARDLKDNFENHRAGAQANGSVTASKFVSRFTDYVAVMAKRADVNGDGFLSRAEARRLPVDLQDNFKNYSLYR